MDIKKSGRYSVDGLSEGEYETGSSNLVLKNLQGIKLKEEIDLLEASLLAETLDGLLDNYDISHSFTIDDLCRIHKLWLGTLYSWAGKYRHVNMSKDGFPFAAAHLIPKLMKDFEKDCLQKYTPCNFKKIEKISEALAIVHAELILIHPFREGNGRIARVLSGLMALQAGLPRLDFGDIQGVEKQRYFSAIQVSMDKNYEPIIEIFYKIIKKTLKLYEK